MFIHNRVSQSAANGPGERTVVWLQGCLGMNCKGCWNPESHQHGTGEDVSILALADWILEQGTNGLTFSGGEPFQQAPALELLISFLKDRRPDFSIGAFTGYTLKELQEGRFHWFEPGSKTMVPGDPKLAKAILKQMDFIIAGRYNELERTMDKPLCGSKNQQVHFLSNRYSDKDLGPNIVEVLVDKEAGLIQITGFPENVAALDAGDDDLAMA